MKKFTLKKKEAVEVTSNPKVIDIEKGNDIVRIQLSEYKKKKYLDIRQHYQDESGEWKPTKKGIAFNLDCLIDEVTVLVDELEEAIHYFNEFTK